MLMRPNEVETPLFSNLSREQIIFTLNSLMQTRVRNGYLLYEQLLMAQAYRKAGLVQIAGNIYIIMINQKN